MDGGNSTPSQHLGLAARWKLFGTATIDFATKFINEGASLVWETWRSVFVIEEQLPVSQLQIRQPQQPISPPPSLPPSPPRPTRPLPKHDLQSRPPRRVVSIEEGPQSKSSKTGQPVEASASSHTVTTWADEAARNRVSTGLPSPPSTETTASSSSSLATGTAPILGLHPQVDAVLANARTQSRPRKTSSKRKWKDDRKHIFHDQHKKAVKEEMIRTREALSQELYQLKRSTSGYSSNLKDFMGWLKYWEQLESMEAEEKEKKALTSPSLTDLRKTTPPDNQRRHSSPGILPTPTFLEKVIRRAKESHESPKPPVPFPPGLRGLLQSRQEKDEALDQRFRPKTKPLPETLPPEDEAAVDRLLTKRGVISKCGREQVSDRDLARLRPGQWLNDEIINFYGQLIQSRSDESKENSAKGKKPLNVHYFSTFFWSKMRNEGYEKARLSKWTKKMDIFSKDIVLIPVNHNNAHWTGAAINFRKKRIESYDSMNMDRHSVFQVLRSYLDAEHRNKKNKPFDFTGWLDYTLKETPMQENGYDCGVFTCQFLETLSRGEETFSFTQRNMPYMRRCMIWEIGHAKLRNDR